MIPWNHTATVYRNTPVRGGFGSQANLTSLGAVSARADMTTNGTTHEAGGERQATNRRWFLSPEVRPTMGDVLHFTAGPESPLRVRVLSVVPAARGETVHHYEVTTEQYTPSVPEQT